MSDYVLGYNIPFLVCLEIFFVVVNMAHVLMRGGVGRSWSTIDSSFPPLWIDAHTDDARALGKPLLLEEVGSQAPLVCLTHRILNFKDPMCCSHVPWSVPQHSCLAASNPC